MSSAAEHIAGWEAAGLLDQVTADRLRAAEAAQPEPSAETPPAPGIATVSAASRMFGPSVQVPEVFGYLGGGFLLAAWGAFMAHDRHGRRRPEPHDRDHGPDARPQC